MLATRVEAGLSSVFEEYDFLSPLEESDALALAHQRGHFIALR
ncbi:MAG: hypothetical protein ABIT01_12400 [Thermoanaerobaculia bacterium]